MDQLALGGFFVGQDQVAVHGQVVLAAGVVDFRRREEGIHAEGPGFVRDDGHNPVAELFVPDQVLEQPDKRHGGCRLLLACAALGHVKRLGLGQLNGLVVRPPFRHGTAQGTAPLMEVGNLRRIMAWMEIGRAVRIFLQTGIGYWNTEIIPEFLKVL